MLEAFEQPTLFDLRDVLQKGYQHFEDKFSKLEDRSFFSKDQFDGSTLKATRESLLTRLGLLLDNYALSSMFTSTTTLLNIGEQMDQAKVIVINNGKDLLEDEGSEFFGRFFLYQMRKAAERRRPLADYEKMPVFCYLDEAHNVIKRDENVATIIQELRSQKIGTIFAHQSVSQIEHPKVRSALEDCAIIFANSAADARYLAPKVNASDASQLNLPIGSFAAYIRDDSDTAVTVKVRANPPQELMTAEERRYLTDQMRRKYCIPPSEPDPAHLSRAEKPLANQNKQVEMDQPRARTEKSAKPQQVNPADDDDTDAKPW
jgi:hypothetical protein